MGTQNCLCRPPAAPTSLQTATRVQTAARKPTTTWAQASEYWPSTGGQASGSQTTATNTTPNTPAVAKTSLTSR